MANTAMIGGYAEGLPIQIPMIDIQEVGTGGGSIARLGAGGAMRVGPQSAGATPGPVCYALGGEEPTVTDANLVLGRLAADRFLGGDMRLDAEGARRAIAERIAAPLGLAPDAAADGIVRIAVAAMAQRGEARHHRARVRRARFSAGVVRRRRPAARGARRPRAADQAGHRAERAGALLGVRHAGRRSAARLRAHPLRAARDRAVRALRPDPRRDGGKPAAPRSAPPRRRRARSRSGTAPTCATSARSTRCRWTSRARSSARATSPASRRCSTPRTRSATATRPRTRRRRS